MWKKILVWVVGTGFISWVFRLPLRLIEDALYDWINTSIIEGWQVITSYFIEWGIPVILAGVVAWLLIRFGMFLSRTKQPQVGTNEKRKAQRESLAEFLEEGQKLKIQCTNESEPPPEDKANEWGYKTEVYLEREFDKSYISIFRSSVGVLLAVCSISSIPHRKLWSGIHTRLYQLGKFIEQLGD